MSAPSASSSIYSFFSSIHFSYSLYDDDDDGDDDDAIAVLEDQLKSGPEMTRIEHLSDLHYPDADPPCHFCSNQSSLSIHDSNRLKIVSGGILDFCIHCLFFIFLFFHFCYSCYSCYSCCCCCWRFPSTSIRPTSFPICRIFTRFSSHLFPFFWMHRSAPFPL